MVRANSVYAASSARPLRLIRRKGLHVQRQKMSRQNYWVVFDTYTRQCTRLSEEEYFLWGQLDGQVSLETLTHRFNLRFRPFRRSVAELQQFTGVLYQKGLVESLADGQGERLFANYTQQNKQWLSQGGNFLAIRLPGFHPGQLLDLLAPLLSWIFTRWGLGFGCTFIGTAGFMLAVRSETFLRQLPTVEQFLSVDSALVFWCILAGTKILHELGHAIACRFYGAECQEMGVMLLFFSPCLYCDVSPAWLLPNKWHRILIASAGMYVELLLASLASFLWWWSEPGLFHNLCLQVIIVCSVTTLAINANPLLHYDGYFILSDLLEIPNLLPASRQQWLNVVRSCLGLPCLSTHQQSFGKQLQLLVYGFLAQCYRVSLLLSIWWFLDHTLSLYGLTVIAQLYIAMMGLRYLGLPLWRWFQYLQIPGVWESHRGSRILFATSALLMVLLILAFVPFPHHIHAEVEVELSESQAVYVPITGRLTQVCFQEGQHVQAGDILARMESPEMELRKIRLETEIAEQEDLISSLWQRIHHEPLISDQLPPSQQHLESLRLQYATVNRLYSQLTLRASQSGVVFTTAEYSPPPSPTQLSTWHGLPLDPQNLNCQLDAGTPFCNIAPPQSFRVQLPIAPDEIPLVQTGQLVEIVVAHSPHHSFLSTISTINYPSHLTSSPALPLEPLSSYPKPESPVDCFAIVQVPSTNSQMLPGTVVRAKIITSPETLTMRIIRSFCSIFIAK